MKIELSEILKTMHETDESYELLEDMIFAHTYSSREEKVEDYNDLDVQAWIGGIVLRRFPSGGGSNSQTKLTV